MRRSLAARSKRNSITGCLEWTGRKTEDGYGLVWVRGPLWWPARSGAYHRAHRVAFEIHCGGQGFHEKPYVCHRCDNPGCIEPDHLFLGTERENARDASAKNRLDGVRRKPLRRLDEAERAEVRARFSKNEEPVAALARAYGASRTAIARALREGMTSEEWAAHVYGDRTGRRRGGRPRRADSQP